MDRGYRYSSRAALCAVLILAAPLQAASGAAPMGSLADPVTYNPDGGWVLEYAEDSCTLSRKFGTGPNRLTLNYTYEGAVRRPWVRLIEHGRGEAVERAVQVRLGIEPGGVDVPVRGAVLPAKGGARVTSMSGSQHLDQLRGAKLLRLGIDTANYHLPLGDMSKVYSEADRCIDDLISNWGQNPKDFGNVRSAPMMTTSEIDVFYNGAVGTEGFGKEARVKIVVRVGADGQPAGCTVIETNVGAAAGERVCKAAMKNARFKPAVDNVGKPVAGLWTAELDLSAV